MQQAQQLFVVQPTPVSSNPDPFFPSIFEQTSLELKGPTSSIFQPLPQKFNVSSLGEPIFSSSLQKKSKTLGHSITRFYFLFSTHLAYSSSPNPDKIRKYVELRGLKILTTEDSKQGPTRYILVLSNSTSDIHLYGDRKETIEQWRQHLARFCVMMDFSKHYVIGDLLGKGSNGKVALAVSRQDGKKYAVKIFEKMKFITKIRGFVSIISEVEALRKLDHQSIIKLYEIYESADTVKLVLELVEGGELSSKLIQKGYYSEQKCITLMRSLLQGIAYVHSKGIIHRDLKLHNVMLASNDSDKDVKIIDFGFAIDLSNPKSPKRSGTPGYVAPEILGSGFETAISEKVDVFSAGVIFYQLATGTPLFCGNTIEEILKKNKECVVDLTKLQTRSLKISTRDLLARMLEKDPDRRISVAEALEHPCFGVGMSPIGELAVSPEDVPRQETTRYSFDMTNMKSVKVYSNHQSRFADRWGSFNTLSNNNSDLQKSCYKQYLEQGKSSFNSSGNELLKVKRQSSGSGTVVGPKIAFSDENSEEGKSDHSSSPYHNESGNPNIEQRIQYKGIGNNVVASPFHKLAIMNNMRKQQEKLRHGESGGRWVEKRTFTDYVEEFEAERKNSSVTQKRNSVI